MLIDARNKNTLRQSVGATTMALLDIALVKSQASGDKTCLGDLNILILTPGKPA